MANHIEPADGALSPQAAEAGGTAPQRARLARSKGVDENTPPISLALRGGGSHGAFSWGVLDALLEERSLWFEGVSGTSAGAMNAVVMAYGYGRAAVDIKDRREAAMSAYFSWKAETTSASISIWPITEICSPCRPRG